MNISFAAAWDVQRPWILRERRQRASKRVKWWRTELSHAGTPKSSKIEIYLDVH